MKYLKWLKSVIKNSKVKLAIVDYGDDVGLRIYKDEDDSFSILVNKKKLLKKLKWQKNKMKIDVGIVGRRNVLMIVKDLTTGEKITFEKRWKEV